MIAQAAHHLLLGSAIACVAASAVIDVRQRIIPNTMVLCVIALGTALQFLESGPAAVWSLLISGGVFMPLVALAQRGAIGGGDAKMIAATLLLVEPSRVMALLTLIALAGGALAIGFYLFDVLRRWWAGQLRVRAAAPIGAMRDVTAANADGLPYGVAILAGLLLTLWLLP